MAAALDHMKRLAPKVFLVAILAVSIECACVMTAAYDKQPSGMNNVGVLLCLGLAYSHFVVSLVIFAPVQYIYRYPERFELLHRSRYMLECFWLPCILWLFLCAPQEFVSLRSLSPVITLTVVCFHFAISLYAVVDFWSYPFSPDTSAGVLVWRPARFTPRMLYPTKVAVLGAYLFSAALLVTEKYVLTMCSAVLFHFANTRGRLQGRTFAGDVMCQQASTIVLLLLAAYASGYRVYCTSESWLPQLNCVTTTPTTSGMIPFWTPNKLFE
eukprot:GEMP01057497.1.p1 GENE.GEMP01057497.1~~GEMP01057497.1.p1  ORF type:complete len:270 (+),score=37.05 GEMP01057497.1:224-1033(+)